MQLRLYLHSSNRAYERNTFTYRNRTVLQHFSICTMYTYTFTWQFQVQFYVQIICAAAFVAVYGIRYAIFICIIEINWKPARIYAGIVLSENIQFCWVLCLQRKSISSNRIAIGIFNKKKNTTLLYTQILYMICWLYGNAGRDNFIVRYTLSSISQAKWIISS